MIQPRCHPAFRPLYAWTCRVKDILAKEFRCFACGDMPCWDAFYLCQFWNDHLLGLCILRSCSTLFSSASPPHRTAAGLFSQCFWSRVKGKV